MRNINTSRLRADNRNRNWEVTCEDEHVISSISLNPWSLQFAWIGVERIRIGSSNVVVIMAGEVRVFALLPMSHAHWYSHLEEIKAYCICSSIPKLKKIIKGIKGSTLYRWDTCKAVWVGVSFICTGFAHRLGLLLKHLLRPFSGPCRACSWGMLATF